MGSHSATPLPTAAATGSRFHFFTKLWTLPFSKIDLVILRINKGFLRSSGPGYSLFSLKKHNLVRRHPRLHGEVQIAATLL